MPAHEFDCERCGIHVIVIVGESHPENVLCLTCRFIESLDKEDDKEALKRFLERTKEG